MCVGKKIKKYLQSNGISQTHISNITNIPMPKLNLTLNGNRRLTFDEYEIICGVLNVGTDTFLEPKKPTVVVTPGKFLEGKKNKN